MFPNYQQLILLIKLIIIIITCVKSLSYSIHGSYLGEYSVSVVYDSTSSLCHWVYALGSGKFD